jgi:TolA-binding protein
MEHEEPLDIPEPLPKPLPPLPPKPSPRTSGGPYKPSPLPAILTGVCLGAVLVGVGIGLSTLVPKKEEAPAPPSTAATPGAEAKPGTPEPAPAASAKPDALAADVEGLGKRLDALQKQVADLPKPEPADLKPIEAKVDALAKRLDSAAAPDAKGLEDKLAQANAALADSQAKVDALTKAVDSQKGELSLLKDQVKALGEAKPAGVAAGGGGTGVANANAEADFARAVDLYKKNQFGPAREAFVKLQEVTPNDARVWYYAALSNGYATGAWNDGETVRLVTKGIELEKSGNPDAAKINAAFADLPGGTKSWLDAYRARAR